MDNEQLKRILKNAGIATCSPYASCLVAAWAQSRGEEQFVAGFADLAECIELHKRSKSNYHDTLLDEFAHTLRGRFGRDASPSDIVASVSLREEVADFARLLRNRIDSPARQRLTGGSADSCGSAELVRRVELLEDLLGMVEPKDDQSLDNHGGDDPSDWSGIRAPEPDDEV